MKHRTAADVARVNKPAEATNSGEAAVAASQHGSFRYNFSFFGRFNPTQAIMGTSLKYHD
jgi:hypothetical protein